MATTPTPAPARRPAMRRHPPPRPLDGDVRLNSNSRGAVVIAAGDHQWEASAEGNGAVDALFRAVDKALAGVLTGHPAAACLRRPRGRRGPRRGGPGHGDDRPAAVRGRRPRRGPLRRRDHARRTSSRPRSRPTSTRSTSCSRRNTGPGRRTPRATASGRRSASPPRSPAGPSSTRKRAGSTRRTGSTTRPRARAPNRHSGPRPHDRPSRGIRCAVRRGPRPCAEAEGAPVPRPGGHRRADRGRDRLRPEPDRDHPAVPVRPG